MIKIREKFNNGLTNCYMIYSDNYFKVKNKKSGKVFDATRKFPLSIVASNFRDFEETNERIITRK